MEILEIWEDIILPEISYEWLYKISNLWRVKSLRFWKEKILKLWNDWGYNNIELAFFWFNKKYKVHILVAIAFIPNPDNKPEVNHKKWIKTDNRASELEWCTRSENLKHAYNLWLMKIRSHNLWKLWKDSTRGKSVFQFTKKFEFIREFWSTKEAERILWIPNQNIWQCCLKNRATAGWFIWRYYK